MTSVRAVPVALILVATSASAVEHVGAFPAAHMELKDDSGSISCFTYDTDPSVAPIATDCPEGEFVEQLFDLDWNQIGERTVVTGSDTNAAARQPTRVERTCEWDLGDLVEEFSAAEAGDNQYAYCTIECPTGVAISGEATARVPLLGVALDDSVFDQFSTTAGIGTQAVDIFIDSRLPFEVGFQGGYDSSSGEFITDGFVYVIRAAAVCL